MSDSVFLDDDALFVLTGYKRHAKQIAELKKQGIPFKVNAAGRPAVARAIIEGIKQKVSSEWVPKWAANLR